MCENGHNIRAGCKERLPNCPTCKGKFTNFRNIFLANLAATAIYPCKNREAGCKLTFTVDDRNKYLSVCTGTKNVLLVDYLVATAPVVVLCQT